MTDKERFFIDSYGLRAYFVDKDAHIKAIVKKVHDGNVPVYTSDFAIQLFIQDLIRDKKDLTKIKARLKGIQLTSGFKLVKPLTTEEFTDAKIMFEGLDDGGLTLLEWTIFHSMRKNGCNVLITSKGRYTGMDRLDPKEMGEFTSIKVLPKYQRK